jgi:hypothetical protein
MLPLWPLIETSGSHQRTDLRMGRHPIPPRAKLPGGNEKRCNALERKLRDEP